VAPMVFPPKLWMEKCSYHMFWATTTSTAITAGTSVLLLRMCSGVVLVGLCGVNRGCRIWLKRWGDHTKCLILNSFPPHAEIDLVWLCEGGLLLVGCV